MSSKVAIAMIAFVTMAVALPARAVEISFYYPVAVSGPLTKIIEDLAADFQKANPGITVKPIYSGNYGETLAKALTANKSGQPPNVAVLVASDSLTLIDQDAVAPMESLVKTADDKAWLGGFFPAFMMNGRYEGKTYGIPFQRSTQVMYWNKDAFKAAGLDPERPPANWDELVDYGKKLTVRDSAGKVTRWGLIVPSGVTSHWFLQGFTTQNQAKLTNDAGTETYLATPAVVESLQFFVDLSRKYKIMEPGIIDTGTAPNVFIDGRAAIMFHSTGNLTNVKNNAKFPFGVAMLPARKQRGSATGGGSIYIFKKSTPEHRHRLRRAAPGRLGPAGNEAIRKGFPASRGGAGAVAILRIRVFHARRSAHDQGARRCDRRVDHRHQGDCASAEGRTGGSHAHPAQLQELSVA